MDSLLPWRLRNSQEIMPLLGPGDSNRRLNILERWSKAVLPTLQLKQPLFIRKWRENRQGKPLLPQFNSEERPEFIQRWRKFCCTFQELWSLAWPSNLENIRSCAPLCAVIFVLQQGLYLLVPKLLARLVNSEHNGTLQNWTTLAIYATAKLLKNHIFKDLLPISWLPIKHQIQLEIAMNKLETILKDPLNELWITGESISDFNKVVSLNPCLEETLFTLIPLTFNLLATANCIWNILGPYFGIVFSIFCMWYLHRIIYIFQSSTPRKRVSVVSKRAKDAVGMRIGQSLPKTVEENYAREAKDQWRKANCDVQTNEQSSLWFLFRERFSLHVVFYLMFVMMSGLLLQRETEWQRKITDFLSFHTFMEQLVAPLASLSSSLERIQNTYVNIERTSLLKEDWICLLARR